MRRLLAIWFFLPSLVLGQATAPPPPAPQGTMPTFRESVQVRVMDLDVTVTDSKGHAVGDLQKEDFSVKVDGQSVPIDYFTRIEEGTIHAPDLATASPDRVLAEYRKGPDAYVPRHFLMYFDIGSLSVASRKRGLEALRDLVTRFGPSDSARVVMFDRRPTTLVEWTTSKEDIFAALAKIESAGVGMSRVILEQQTVRDLDFNGRGRSGTTRATGAASSRSFIVSSYAEQQRVAIQTLLRDMDSELTTMAPMPGKKAFVYVSGGFEMQPGYAMSQYAFGTATLQAFNQDNMTSYVDAIVHRANSTDVTFYSLDARGLTPTGVSASQDDPLLNRPGVGFVARQDSQTGLIELAHQTGGFALLDTNNLQGGAARVYAETSTYYSIGVNISKLPGTGYRKVVVDVNRPGLTVRSRRGYAPRTPQDRGRDVTMATLRSNVEYRAIPVDLRIAQTEKAKKYYEVPIQLSVPASAFTFLTDANGSQATADIFIAVLDDKGYTSDVGHYETVFKLAQGASHDTALKYQTKLQMRKGNMRIAVNVQDRESGRMGTAKADVNVQ